MRVSVCVWHLDNQAFERRSKGPETSQELFCRKRSIVSAWMRRVRCHHDRLSRSSLWSRCDVASLLSVRFFLPHALSAFCLSCAQFYNKKSDTLCYRDKYWGRKLTKGMRRRPRGQTEDHYASPSVCFEFMGCTC